MIRLKTTIRNGANCIANRAIHELSGRDKNGEGHPARDDELEFNLLNSGGAPEVPHKKDDQDDNRACQQRPENGKERTINRQRNHLMTAFPTDLSRAKKKRGVAAGNGHQTRNRHASGPPSDFLPSAVPAENAQAQQIESIHHENAGGPGVANPERGFHGIRGVEGELEGKEPRGDEERDKEKALVRVVSGIGAVNSQPKPKLNEQGEPEGDIGGVHSRTRSTTRLLLPPPRPRTLIRAVLIRRFRKRPGT